MGQVEITKPFERWHFRVEYYDIGHIQSSEEVSNIDNALMKRIENFFKGGFCLEKPPTKTRRKKERRDKG